uniref:Thioredoxin domain-containing protein n=1 Tax=viral metagenome TaxID=1070528 RepID=A0A6C0JX14_9ZZZZ
MLVEAIVACIVVSFFIVGYYIWTGIPPGARLVEQVRPIDTGLEDHQSTCMFFYVPWCPHCKTAKAAWASLKQVVKNENLQYGGKTVSFQDVNGDVDKGKTALYAIRAYPTFKLQTKDKLYEMVGPPTVTNFRSFLKQALGDEKSSH